MIKENKIFLNWLNNPPLIIYNFTWFRIGVDIELQSNKLNITYLIKIFDFIKAVAPSVFPANS